MDRHHGERAVGMNYPFRFHEGVGRLVAHRERGRQAAAFADHGAGIELEVMLGRPGMGAFLALELGYIQGPCDERGSALQQLDVVWHVVLVGLEADAARFDALRCQVEAELQQPAGGGRRVGEGQRKVIDVARRNLHARSYRLNGAALKCDGATLGSIEGGRKMSKLTLYGIWLSGPTYKAGLAMSLMGQSFAYKHVDLRAGAHKQADYLAINRFGQVPALVDGDLKLCQSGSILLYLADKFGKTD